MKLGILTFHMAHNYGAMIQAYSLQEYLKSCGHDVSIIDYRPEYFSKIYKRGHYNVISRNPYKFLRNILFSPILKRLLKRRYDAFDKFANQYYTLEAFSKKNNGFNAIFLGSDQIWNKNITGGTYDDYYWGKAIQCPSIAYAASGIVNPQTEVDKHYVTDALNNLLSISVRESSLAKYLEPYSEKEINVVCDPTLLAGKEILSKLDTKHTKASDYILIYELNIHPQVRKYAERLAREHKLRIIELTSEVRINKLLSSNQTASPKDFITLIKNAKLVLTTSFHGTALSIIFERDFYYFRQHNLSDARIIDLLDILNLQNRIIEMDSIPNLLPIDYDIARPNLENYVNISKEFIKKSLEKC